MIRTQKPITFKNICGAIVDFKELAKAILWYSDRPVCSIKKIYMHGKYPAVSIGKQKVHIHRLLMMYWCGYIFPSDIYVHHIDENTHNNDMGNLQVMKSGEHQRHHGLLRGKTYARIKCPNCGNVYVKLKRDSIDKKQYNCSKKCGRLFQLLSKTEQEERIKNCILEIFKQH